MPYSRQKQVEAQLSNLGSPLRLEIDGELTDAELRQIHEHRYLGIDAGVLIVRGVHLELITRIERRLRLIELNSGIKQRVLIDLLQTARSEALEAVRD